MTGFAEFIEGMRGGPEDRPDPLTRARLAHVKPDEPPDDDERQAALLARRYEPGSLSGLARQLADAQAELAAVEEQNARAVRRQERVARDHRAGKITAFDIMAMDLDEPDRGREAQLARRCERLRAQVGEASMRITPAPRLEDPLESASRRAHEAFRAATLAAIEAAEEGRPVRRERRPFGSPGGYAVRADGEVTCDACLAVGATPEESFLIHHTDADGNPLATAPEAELPAPAGGQQASRAGRVLVR
jgi:hypothetical protein